MYQNCSLHLEVMAKNDTNEPLYLKKWALIILFLRNDSI